MKPKAGPAKPTGKLGGELLFEADHIVIEFNPRENWIYANWVGEQREEHIRGGGDRMVAAMREMRARHGCRKVLNDNRHVQGLWGHSVQWAAEEWFPAMVEAGLAHFAWILSPSALSNMAGTRLRLRAGDRAVHVFKTFSDIGLAQDWLRSSK